MHPPPLRGYRHLPRLLCPGPLLFNLSARCVDAMPLQPATIKRQSSIMRALCTAHGMEPSRIAAAVNLYVDVLQGDHRLVDGLQEDSDNLKAYVRARIRGAPRSGGACATPFRSPF